MLPRLGAARLADIRCGDLQDVADRLLAEGRDASTIRNAIAPLRAIYRRAVTRGDVAVNPTTGLELPAPKGRRDRVAEPAEASALLAALGVDDRPVWATAMYAGLRRGELLALRWADVDLAAGVIRVKRSYDAEAGEFVEPKSRAGMRAVPIAALLRDVLVEHKLRSGRRDDDLVFGRTRATPLDPRALLRRAETAWKRAGREAIGLHECRHTFASLMIAAGVNAKALSTYMGHASITITLDRYGQLDLAMRGRADEDPPPPAHWNKRWKLSRSAWEQQGPVAMMRLSGDEAWTVHEAYHALDASELLLEEAREAVVAVRTVDLEAPENAAVAKQVARADRRAREQLGVQIATMEKAHEVLDRRLGFKHRALTPGIDV